VIPSRLPDTHQIAKDVASIIGTLIETRSVEYKESAKFAALEPHIVKTAMALSNLRAGGFLIVGVARGQSGLRAAGISTTALATYDADGVLAAINKFASPAVNATVAIVAHRNKDYLVIAVQEFERTPTVSKRNGAWHDETHKIVAGSIYIRPPGLVETRLPSSAAELDEVIELAAEKRAIRMVAQRDLLNITAATALASVAPAKPWLLDESQTERYNRELGDDAGQL
jgi:hypothetical protein